MKLGFKLYVSMPGGPDVDRKPGLFVEQLAEMVGDGVSMTHSPTTDFGVLGFIKGFRLGHMLLIDFPKYVFFLVCSTLDKKFGVDVSIVEHTQVL